ncbi:MAG: hypothetical protein WCF84_01340 [Anaerolineae bacterium]
MWKAVAVVIVVLLALTACDTQNSSALSGAEPVFAKSTRPAERSTEQPAGTVQPGDKGKATEQPEKAETEGPEQDGTPGPKVGICHRTGSQSNPYVYIQVSPNAVPAHQAQGDIVNVTSADACPKTAPAASGTPGNPGKGKGRGGLPDGKGPHGNDNGQGEDQGNED